MDQTDAAEDREEPIDASLAVVAEDKLGRRDRNGDRSGSEDEESESGKARSKPYSA